MQAIERFTEAITLDRNNYLLFSNRSAAYARVGRFPEALDDARRCHELKPDWPKVSTHFDSLNTRPQTHHQLIFITTAKTQFATCSACLVMCLHHYIPYGAVCCSIGRAVLAGSCVGLR